MGRNSDADALYWTRIQTLKGAKTTDKATDKNQRLMGNAPEAVSDDFPVMRAEWQQAVLAYRSNVIAKGASR